MRTSEDGSFTAAMMCSKATASFDVFMRSM